MQLRQICYFCFFLLQTLQVSSFVCFLNVRSVTATFTIYKIILSHGIKILVSEIWLKHISSVDVRLEEYGFTLAENKFSNTEDIWMSLVVNSLA